mmetsp:Transcript_7475/g.9272  ORF Transcript_7475/g.9272 Transcript_7475/m.9272 type:complete len:85 (-) Transcript_7475:3632-3886(-)
MDTISEYLEFPIDFKGQEKTEDIVHKSNYLIIPISLIVGWFTQDLFLTVVTFLVQFVIVLLIVLPNWPLYNRNPVSWIQIKYEL